MLKYHLNMSHSPFDIFIVKDIINTPWFKINNINVCFICIFFFMFILGLLFRYTKNNLIHDLVMNTWIMINDLLNEKNTKNEDNVCEKMPTTNPNTFFFFSIFFLMLLGNIVSRLPGINPALSLLVVSVPLHFLIILYFLYLAFRIHGKKIVNVFFNPDIVLPIRLFIGVLEIVSLFVKVFSFSIRLLANITAGHILMWVIETFVQNINIYLKILPFIFLVLIYIMEIAIGLLQSYIFLLLSITIFKSMEKIHH